MIGISHFLLLLTLGVGQIAIYITIQSYKTNRQPYLFSYILVLVGFNAITLAHTIETFLKATLPETYLLESGADRYNWIYILLSLIRLFILFHMARFLWGIFLKEWPRQVSVWAWMLTVAFCLVQPVRFIGYEWGKGIPEYSSVFIHVIFFVILTFLLAKGIQFSGKIKNRQRRSALTTFIFFLLLFNILLFLNRIGGYASWITLNLQMLVISILMLAFNIYHVFFFGRFLRDYLIVYPAQGSGYLDSLVERYQITKREREIILLVCEGKSNKEIAAELFISPVTVRDHLANAFAKVQVKSRLQLANMFRGNVE